MVEYIESEVLRVPRGYVTYIEGGDLWRRLDELDVTIKTAESLEDMVPSDDVDIIVAWSRRQPLSLKVHHSRWSFLVGELAGRFQGSRTALVFVGHPKEGAYDTAEKRMSHRAYRCEDGEVEVLLDRMKV